MNPPFHPFQAPFGRWRNHIIDSDSQRVLTLDTNTLDKEEEITITQTVAGLMNGVVVPRICQNCKWWTPPPSPQSGMCRNILVGSEDARENGIHAWSSPPLYAAPNFGCIHFDPK